jgi:hypothetical protein
MVERCVMSEIESKAYVTIRSEKKLRDGGEGKKSIILGPLAQRPALEYLCHGLQKEYSSAQAKVSNN